MWDQLQWDENVPHDFNRSTGCITFPVIVVRNGHARIVHFLALLFPDHSPRISVRQLSDDATRAAENTLYQYSLFHTAFKHHLVLLPLLEDNTPAIRGGSFSLPLGLALDLLVKGKIWPEKVYASAGLKKNGTLAGVSGLEHKRRLWVEQEAEAVLVSSMDAQKLSGIRGVIGCDTLMQAINDLEFLLVAREPDRVVHLRACMRDGAEFLRHLHEIPLAILNLPQVEQLLTAIKEDRAAYLAEASRVLLRCMGEPEKAELLTDLFAHTWFEDSLRLDGDYSPEPFFDWAVARATFANHTGDIEGAKRWTRLQKRCCFFEPGPEQLQQLNLQFVGERFNRFSFTAEVPIAILNLLEEEEARNRLAFRPNLELGAMYGTLAQNCGFCGPKHLDGLYAFADKARRAFGKRFAGEAGRLHNYLFYALLDTGEEQHRREAVVVLNRYLLLDSGAGFVHWYSRLELLLKKPAGDALFQVAALLRGMADLRIKLPPSRCSSLHAKIFNYAMRSTHHPWQFIIYNWARLLVRNGRMDDAVACIERMVRICRKNGETMQVMALLGFALFHKVVKLLPEHRRELERLMMLIQDTSVFNRDHFAPLLNSLSIDQALDLLNKNPALIFPFSYR